MSQKENKTMSIPAYSSNNSFSLLIPYYSSDKWTNKLKNKVKSLAEAYKAFYKRLEQENSTNSEKDEETRNQNIKLTKHNKYFSQNIFNKTSLNTKSNISNINTNENEYNQKNILNSILPPVTNFKYYENESKENIINLWLNAKIKIE